jgi:acetyltransferase
MKLASDLLVKRLDTCAHDYDAFAALMIDAVESGASIGFLPPLSREAALRYWRDVDAALAGNKLLFAAYVGNDLAGTVQLELAGQVNGAHRAEVQKLCVKRPFRGRGIARALMMVLEDEAVARGRSLLVLDTRLGDPSEHMYQRFGYQRAGVIPAYARSADGTLSSTVLFYKTIPAS